MNTSVWWYALGLTIPWLTSMLRVGATPWYLRPPACIGGTLYVWPTVCILSIGVSLPESA